MLGWAFAAAWCRGRPVTRIQKTSLVADRTSSRRSRLQAHSTLCFITPAYRAADGTKASCVGIGLNERVSSVEVREAGGPSTAQAEDRLGPGGALLRLIGAARAMPVRSRSASAARKIRGQHVAGDSSRSAA